MAALSYKQKQNLPKSAFAIPSERKYNIKDRRHAANALARVTQHGTPAEKAQVRKAVCNKYPSFPSCQKRK